MTTEDYNSRRKAKNAQRAQAMVFIVVFSILCFAVSMYWVSVNYFNPVEQPVPGAVSSEPTTLPMRVTTLEPGAAATRALSATLQPDEAATQALPATLPALPTETQQTFQQTEEILAKMSLQEKIGQMILVGLGGKQVSESECQIIKEIMPGGIVFHGGNISDPDQLRNLIASLKNCSEQSSRIALIFAMDHEGQYINRFKTGGATIFPSAQAIGATGDSSYAYRVALASGQEISSFGINMVLGPVADVLTDLDNVVIGERSYGGEAEQVGKFVAQAVLGYREAGLIPVLKHFPGHGASSIDSHLGLPVDQGTLQSLRIDHFPPFSAGLAAGAQVVMTGHTALPKIDPQNRPSSLSEPIIKILREELGFKGVLITDSLDMGALQSTGLDAPNVALSAAKAGNDMLLILSSSDAQNASRRINQAVDETGELSIDQINASVRRILSLKEQNAILLTYPERLNPNFAVNQTLADEVGRRAVAILKNEAGLIPAPANLPNILVIAPPEIWGLNAAVLNAFRSKGFVPQLAQYPAPWLETVGTDEMIRSLVAQAANSDMTIVLTWQAHTNRLLYSDDWQGRMVNALQKSGVKLLVAGLKSPTDILEFPGVSTFIATFGTTPGQIQALADILAGNASASGVNPLPQLP